MANMNSNAKIMRQVLLMTGTAIVGGTIGYHQIEEGWSYFDSFYMTIITLTTIGFGEVHELSVGGRIFTIVLVMFGLGAAATFAAHFARMLIEGDLEEYWRKRRMERIINRLKDHVIVCGYGRIGRAICQELTDMGTTCVVVDNDADRQHEARDHGLIVVHGNATSDLALISAGISRSAAVVAALSSDSENVFVALTARDLNPDVAIIARAEDRTVESRMIKAGVDRVAYPAQLCGGQIAHLVGKEVGLDVVSKEFRRATDVLGYDLKIYRNVSAGIKSLNEILEETNALKALAVVHLDGTRSPDPDEGTVIDEMDAVILLVDTTIKPREHKKESTLRSQDSADLSVGVTSLDEEHQQILNLIQSLESAGQDDRQVIKDVLRSLVEYTQRHFRAEEALFLKTDYPHAREHVAEHKTMVHKVKQMVEDEAHVHPANLARLLEEWLIHHIQKTDKGYVKYLAKELVP